MSASYQHVVWPSTLHQLLASHLQCVDHPDAPSFPPFGDGKRNCYAVLRDIFERLNTRQGASREYNEMMFHFIIQLMEDCCQKSFLRPREREKLKAQFSRRHGHPGPVRKRKEDDYAIGTDGEKPQFTLQLPPEYLLRFFVALPLLVDTFLNFCGGGGLDKSLVQGLWKCTELVLRELDATAVFYSPILEYQP